MGPRRGVPTLILGLAMTVVAGSTWGIEQLGISPAGVWATFVTWGTLCLVGMIPGAFNRAGLPFALLRATFLLSSVSYGAAFGATSRLPASPAYVMGFVMATACGVFLIGRSTVLLAIIVLVPLAMRLVFVPSPSVGSLIVAFLVGCGLSSLAAFVTRRAAESSDMAAETEEAIEQARESGTLARLGVLTSLHDGVSGLLLVARTRLASGASESELETLVTQLTLRGAELTQLAGHSDLPRAQRELEAVAGAIGARVDVRLEGSALALPQDDRRQLVQLATEATLNALRAAPTTVIEILLDASDDAVRFEARSRGTQTPALAGGRGLAFAKLRARLRGGSARVENEDGFVLRVWWPRKYTAQRVGFPSFPVTLIGFLGPAIGLAWWQDAWAALGLSAYATVSAAVMFEQMRGAARAQEQAARDAEAALERDAPIRAEVRAALLGPHEQLSHAWRLGDRAALARALDAYSASVRSLLEAHERALFEA